MPVARRAATDATLDMEVRLGLALSTFIDDHPPTSFESTTSGSTAAGRVSLGVSDSPVRISA